ncbi:MAG: helix-turn-helix domain-containing protein [Candidatus Binataceae bacterium]
MLTINDIILDPTAAANLPQAEVARLLVECAAAQTILAAHLAAPPPAPSATVPEQPAINGHEPDTLLTVREAARRLKCSEKTLRRRRRELPFFVHMPGRAVRISERRLNKFLERRT